MLTSAITIKQFLGLRQDPYGTVNVKPGEASAMRNFRITDGYHLQVRPGSRTILRLAACSAAAEGEGTAPDEKNTPVRGMFSGKAGETACFLVAQGGHIWNVDLASDSATDLGTLTDRETFFFPFDGKIYLLNGTEYLFWDGTGGLQTVTGYVPLIAVATPPEGGGTLLEPLNLLTGAKRQQFSPDGTSVTFQMGEGNIDSVDRVIATDGSVLPDYTADLAGGALTFASAPPQGVNTIEITWTKGAGERSRVCAMEYAECFNGASDTRVFLYGDGTNDTLYSGLTETGMPTAEYFPALNILSVDRKNTPVTGMIRHGARLLAFKPDGAFAIAYDTLTLADGSVIPAFYVTTLNREVGNEASGQVRLLLNWPYTLKGHGIYRWISEDSIQDERSAVRVSGRVEQTLLLLDFNRITTFDDGDSQEYYLFFGNECLVYHYGLDVWYRYVGLEVTAAQRAGGELYFGTADGRLIHVSRQYRSDDEAPIDALWESGSMDFGAGARRVHLLPLTVSMQPEASARANVTLRSNRRGVYRRRVIAYSFCTFTHANFEHFSFRSNQRPQKQRLRIPARGTVYDQLVIESCSASATATILEVQMEAQLGNALH
ncbi:MAG: hypothetical protein ACOX0U_04925 [Oscillospiraceae bacterium]|jgi:hypothetical protein